MGEITGKKYDTVVFDMDGTLLDTLEDLRDAVNYALRMHGMPERTTEEIRRFVGNGVRKLLVRSVPEGDKNPEFEAVFQAFREYYAVHSNDKTHAYKGVTELLKKLRDAGYAVAIVSNKPDAAVKNLNQIYFDGIVETAIGEREGMDKKPAPDMVLKAIEELGKTKETAVYVGDSEVDIETARNAGLPCISVLWGFRERDFLAARGAQVFAEAPEEVWMLLEEGKLP